MGIRTGFDYDLEEDVRWIITKWTRHITDSRKDETINKKPAELNHKFRLLDDDGHVYGYGYTDNNSSFLPLDIYRGAYGCVDIQYKNPKTGEYESL